MESNWILDRVCFQNTPCIVIAVHKSAIIVVCLKIFREVVRAAPPAPAGIRAASRSRYLPPLSPAEHRRYAPR